MALVVAGTLKGSLDGYNRHPGGAVAYTGRLAEVYGQPGDSRPGDLGAASEGLSRESHFFGDIRDPEPWASRDRLPASGAYISGTTEDNSRTGSDGRSGDRDYSEAGVDGTGYNPGTPAGDSGSVRVSALVAAGGDPTPAPRSDNGTVHLDRDGWFAQPYDAAFLAVSWRIDGCESGHGTYANTYSLNSGGRMQLDPTTWEQFFLTRYGWNWSDIVFNDALNLAAAYIVYERAGGWFPWTGTRFCWG